nr:immunoglobulin heavy chain junction region [Macaca mulatta]
CAKFTSGWSGYFDYG